MKIDLKDINVLIESNPRTFDSYQDVAFKALSDSISSEGLKEPLVVAFFDSAYYLVAGHRRYMACSELGVTSVPVVVDDSIKSIEDLEESIVKMQMLNSSFDHYEIGVAVSTMIEKGRFKTPKEFAIKYGLNVSTVVNCMKLVLLPPELIPIAKDGRHLANLFYVAPFYKKAKTLKEKEALTIFCLRHIGKTKKKFQETLQMMLHTPDDYRELMTKTESRLQRAGRRHKALDGDTDALLRVELSSRLQHVTAPSDVVLRQRLRNLLDKGHVKDVEFFLDHILR